MAQKKITDLQLIDAVTDALNFPGDDTLQTYRVTALQLIAYIESKLHLPTTGDAFLTLKSVAPAGWLMMNDGTIGSAASGATTRANDDTQDLYELLWNNVSNTYAAVTGGRGSDAESDFLANKPIALTKQLGRAIAIAGAGASLTSRALGLTIGTETHTLSTAEMPSHTHTQNAHKHGMYVPDGGYALQNGGAGDLNATQGGTEGQARSPKYDLMENTTATNQNTGGGGAHNNMQPSAFWNVMIKL